MSGDQLKSVITRSLMLKTPLFSVGYSWRKEQASAEELQTRATIQAAPAQGPMAELSADCQDPAHEARRRQQLMSLLDDTALASPNDNTRSIVKGHPNRAYLSLRARAAYQRQIGHDLPQG